MKILITGYTSPIGDVLTRELQKNHEIIKVSRTSGYDLYKDLDRVIKISEDVDHFLNLANVGNSQIELLDGVYYCWERLGKSGKIISFGTLATSVPYELLKKIPVDVNMLSNKLLLEKLHNELSFRRPFGPQPQSVLLRFANFGKKEGKRSNEPYTTEEQMIYMINFILETSTYISTIDFREI
jgi:hypothetical protein